MRNALYTFIYILSLAVAGLGIHQAFAQSQPLQRTPSVEPLAEIEIGAVDSKGYDFSAQRRVPATAVIRQKENSNKYSYLGPILFFMIALPFVVWSIITKTLKSNNNDEKKAAYYSNTHQFTPYKTDYQKHDDENSDDDIDYPKSA
jgi:hypothetical protein